MKSPGSSEGVCGPFVTEGVCGGPKHPRDFRGPCAAAHLAHALIRPCQRFKFSWIQRKVDVLFRFFLIATIKTRCSNNNYFHTRCLSAVSKREVTSPRLGNFWQLDTPYFHRHCRNCRKASVKRPRRQWRISKQTLLCITITINQKINVRLL